VGAGPMSVPAIQEVNARVTEAVRLAGVEDARAVHSDEAASKASTSTAQDLHERHAAMHRKAAGAHRRAAEMHRTALILFEAAATQRAAAELDARQYGPRRPA